MLLERIGDPDNAHRVTVNLSREVSDELKNIALRCNVSESSVVEIALRQLLRRVNPAALTAFLRAHGGCLRRRRS
jgi:predicted transcriptional regulator